jgi:hypothetical protein
MTLDFARDAMSTRRAREAMNLTAVREHSR